MHLHKFKKPGVQYEIGISILGGDICWVEGPLPCGAYPDVKVFRCGLKGWLEEGERVEADKGYRGECPSKAKIPHELYSRNKEVTKMKKKVAGRHETVNSRIKQYACMQGLFRHDVMMHSACLRCVLVLVLVQLSIENGDELFFPEYYNY